MNDEQKYLLNSALKFLGHRPRSKKEITDFLKKKTSDETLINETLAQLEKLKLVNDYDFAKWLVKSRSRNRGSIFIRQDLKKYGIESQDIETNDLETAISLLKKKHNLWKNLSSQAYYLKASRYLAYRGIPGSVIAQAIKKVYNAKDVN